MNGVCAICKVTNIGPNHFHTSGHLSRQAIVERREDREDPQLRLLPDVERAEPARIGHGTVALRRR